MVRLVIVHRSNSGRNDNRSLLWKKESNESNMLLETLCASSSDSLRFSERVILSIPVYLVRISEHEAHLTDPPRLASSILAANNSVAVCGKLLTVYKFKTAHCLLFAGYLLPSCHLQIACCFRLSR